MSIYGRKSARSSRFPCPWPIPPHRARPLPTPPALFLPPSSLPGPDPAIHPRSAPPRSLPLAWVPGSQARLHPGMTSPVPLLSKLEKGGLHEIKPEGYSDKPASLAFALAVIAQQAAARNAPRDLVLWCLTRQAAREWGRPYGPGLIAYGLDPALLLVVMVRNETDAAWALEEGLKSRALIAALAAVEIETPLMARRLGLAAQSSRTPCLLLSGSSQRKPSRNRHDVAHRRAKKRCGVLRCHGARKPFLAAHARALPGRSAGAQLHRGVQS